MTAATVGVYGPYINGDIVCGIIYKEKAAFRSSITAKALLTLIN